MLIQMPDPVADVLARLKKAGYQANIVGGCVRDSLMGFTPQDWDVTTSALPEETKRALGDLRVLETGVRHGTVTALCGGMEIEITTYRVDGKYSDSRHPDSVTFTRSLKEDLARRDFTVNAMAYDGREVIDYYGGAEDLRNRIIRCVGDPDQRFCEDSLRILRGLRFSACLGFAIEPDTSDSICKNKELLKGLAAERVAAELVKLLCGKDAARVLRGYPAVIGVILPEILPAVGFEQHNPHHCHDVWEHTLHSLEAVEADPVLKLAMLLHDLGKPHCHTRDEAGTGHFYGHGKISLQLAENITKRLKLDRETAGEVCLLVKQHDTRLVLESSWIKRQLRRFGERYFRQLLKVKAADCMAQSAICRHRLKDIKRAEEMLEEILREEQCFQLKDLALNGSDLKALGIPEGPEIGGILNSLLDAVIDGGCQNERGALLRLARGFWEGRHV